MKKFNPSRPALRYYGGSWARADWTISYFPPHQNYLEPCFGAGSILLNKPMSKLETVNDKDGRVVNFFEVLRSRIDELIHQIWMTPWAEVEYRKCLEVADDPLEDARRFFFTSWASIKGGPYPGVADFRWQKKVTRRSAAVRDIAVLDHLYVAADRLKNVQILNRDALEIIAKFTNQHCLIYFDPPYLADLRSNRYGYRHEVDEAWHIQAAELLRKAIGPVVIAGYPSSLYKEIFEKHGWKRVERSARTNSGGRKVDALWLSPGVNTMRLL